MLTWILYTIDRLLHYRYQSCKISICVKSVLYYKLFRKVCLESMKKIRPRTLFLSIASSTQKLVKIWTSIFSGECPWLDIKFIKNLISRASVLYPRVAYGVGFVPTYPSGQMGYLLCSKDEVSLTIVVIL